MSIYYEMFRKFSQSGYDLLTYYTSIVKRRISLVLIVPEYTPCFLEFVVLNL